ncbi:putative uncharacterized protein [Eggerthella sp. CAG:298]|nr:putative uncharacterized protein [Eggerthella sp. CAG:298]
MSARSKKQNAQRNFGNASSEGAEKWTPKAKDVAGDSQPTPAYGFPAVSADDVKANQAAQQKANATNTANATQWNNGSNYDFLWEAADTKRSAKGQAGTTTVVESDTDYLLLPHPDVFNAYPPEVQRKIMEWADRDVRARRDDESLRQDALIRAQAARERTIMAVPVAIIILCIVCATITGMFTKSAVFAVTFLVVAIVVIMALYFTRKNDLYVQSDPYEDEEENEEE